jgi:hypothetical protein
VVAGPVSSHFIHLDFPTPASVIGTVTFNAPIIGVAFSDTFLDLSDAPCGALGTVYPTGFVGRGFNSVGLISINANVLRFEFRPTATGALDPEQVRVFTRGVPEPGALALLGLGGLTALRRRRSGAPA